MVVGYIRSYDNNRHSLQMQQDMIIKYCEGNGLAVEQILCDEHSRKPRSRRLANELASLGYHERYKGEWAFTEFDNLVLMIADGIVKTVITDFLIRLRVNSTYDSFFMELCRKHQVSIIEAGSYPPEDVDCTVRAAIYHDTNKSAVRSIYTVKDFDALYTAAHQNGWAVVSAMIDDCRNINGRGKFSLLKENLDRYDIIISKALFNIDIKTGQLIQTLIDFRCHNVRLYTLLNGETAIYTDGRIKEQNLRAVFYDSFSRTNDEMVLLREIINAFVRHKTNWELAGAYYEGHRVKKDEEQKVLNDILGCQSGFDLIIVKSFNRVNARTARLEQVLSNLRKDKAIYSIEEGAYLYGKA